MQLDTDLTGLFGSTLAIVTLIFRLPRTKGLPLRRRLVVLFASIIVLSVPVWGLSLAGFVRGITGDLSLATLILLGLALVRSLAGRVLVEEHNRRAMLLAILIAAALFYPFALGLSMFDPYRLGYGDLWFMAALLGVAVWAGLRYSTLLAWCIALAVAAWGIGWYESPNLWDYLFDPWLAIYAAAVQVKCLWVRWRGKAHA